MQQSPWRTYFGQMHKSSSSKESTRHPFVVALTAVGIISIITAAVLLRFNRWYYGKISVLTLCEDRQFNLTRRHPVLPINEPLSYCLGLAVPPLIILCIELLYLTVSLDAPVNDNSDGDDVKPRLLEGMYLFFFRFLHFIAVLFLTAAFVSTIVDITKIVFDWHRPYLLREFPFNCDPNFVEQNPRRTLTSEEINARLGFPSYRVAQLSSSAVLLSAQSVITLRALRSSGPLQAVIVLLCALAPLFAAASVLGSRENRPEDVVVGLLIGVISAAYMASMLPTKLMWTDSETKSSKLMPPTTIEELNSLAPMRQAATYNGNRPSIMLRRYPASQRVPSSGLTAQ